MNQMIDSFYYFRCLTTVYEMVDVKMLNIRYWILDANFTFVSTAAPSPAASASVFL